MRKNNLTLPPDGAVWRALLLTLVLTSCTAHAEFPQDQADAERKATRDAQIKRQAEWKRKHSEAKPIFDKLCAEQSQPIIKRTVEDVEGVLLLKVREAIGPLKYVNDPNWPEAAWPGFGRTRVDGYAGFAEDLLLDWRWQRFAPDPNEVSVHWWAVPSLGGQMWEDPNAKSSDERMKRASAGFKYVDVLGSDGATRTRVTALSDPSKSTSPYRGIDFKYAQTTLPAPRYAVTFEDNLDPELRKHWIAGITIKVIDTKTREVIGQRSFWSLETGFGATGQFGTWSTNARRCPRLSDPMGLIYSTLKTKSGN